MLKVVYRIKVSGGENIPLKGGVILAANHVSYLDPVVIGVGSRRKVNFLARHDLFRNPLFAWIIRSLGAFPVKRNSADLSALKEAIKRLKSGKTLLIFPEGTRQDVLTQKAHPGIGFLAAKTGVPVIPVFIKGTETALPKKAKFLRKSRIFVHFGKSISYERRLPYQKIAQEVMIGIKNISCSLPQ